MRGCALGQRGLRPRRRGRDRYESGDLAKLLLWSIARVVDCAGEDSVVAPTAPPEAIRHRGVDVCTGATISFLRSLPVSSMPRRGRDGEGA